MVNKLLISLWSALLFIAIAAPFTFKLTGQLFSKLGLKTQTGGCPNMWGLLIHTVVFAVLVWVMMLIPLPGSRDKYVYSPYRGYSGLANPAGMAQCNRAQLAAQDAGCNVCFDAAQTCMRHPYSSECTQVLENCQNSNCSSPGTARAVVKNCQINRQKDYFTRSPSCT